MDDWVILLYMFVFGLWLVFIQGEQGIGVGVRFLYVVNLSLQMLLGPLIYWLSGYPEWVESAAVLSLIGILSFFLGGYIVAPGLAGVHATAMRDYWRRLAAEIDLARHRRIAFRLLIIGLVCQPLLGRAFGVGTVRSLIGQATLLSYTGSVLLLLNGIWGRNRRHILEGVAATVLSAAFGGLVSGFMAAGFTITFVACCMPSLSWGPSARKWLLVLVVGIASLIPYNAWISGREGLRKEVDLNHSLTDRAEAFLVGAVWSNPLDLFSMDEVKRIRFRIDESRWFARAIEHTPRLEPFAHGKTFWNAVLALVPRAIWPEKTVSAGGFDFIEKYTGVNFGTHVSLGMHPIFEFYVNFGVLGVMLGMFIFGVLCGALDYVFLLRGASSLLIQVAVLQLSWALLSSNVMAEFVMSAGATLGVAVIVGLAVRNLRHRGYLIPSSIEEDLPAADEVLAQ